MQWSTTAYFPDLHCHWYSGITAIATTFVNTKFSNENVQNVR